MTFLSKNEINVKYIIILYRICMAMGQAAAAAASVMCKTKTTTSTVDVEAIRDHLIGRGVRLRD